MIRIERDDPRGLLTTLCIGSSSSDFCYFRASNMNKQNNKNNVMLAPHTCQVEFHLITSIAILVNCKRQRGKGAPEAPEYMKLDVHVRVKENEDRRDIILPLESSVAKEWIR